MLLEHARQRVKDAAKGAKLNLTDIDKALMNAGRALYTPRLDAKGRQIPLRGEHHKYVNWTIGRAHGGLVKLPDATAEQVVAAAVKTLNPTTKAERPTAGEEA